MSRSHVACYVLACLYPHGCTWVHVFVVLRFFFWFFSVVDGGGRAYDDGKLCTLRAFEQVQM